MTYICVVGMVVRAVMYEGKLTGLLQSSESEWEIPYTFRASPLPEYQLLNLRLVSHKKRLNAPLILSEPHM